MITFPELLDEEKWPRSIRKAINRLIAIGKRPCVIGYGDVENPTWDREDNQDKITLPNPAGGISATIVVCVDNGDGSYTQKLATFTNGNLTSLE